MKWWMGAFHHCLPDDRLFVALYYNTTRPHQSLDNNSPTHGCRRITRSPGWRPITATSVA
jgi:transposase InsO family protein